jgi:hypothetical protein
MLANIVFLMATKRDTKSAALAASKPTSMCNCSANCCANCLLTTGSQCWAIKFNMPPASRGQEVSAAQLDALGAQLVRH